MTTEAIDKEDFLQSLTRVIKKVWKVDPLEGSKCRAEMKVISFIDERRSIRLILEHLDLWSPRIWCSKEASLQLTQWPKHAHQSKTSKQGVS